MNIFNAVKYYSILYGRVFVMISSLHCGWRYVVSETYHHTFALTQFALHFWSFELNEHTKKSEISIEVYIPKFNL